MTTELAEALRRLERLRGQCAHATAPVDFGLAEGLLRRAAGQDTSVATLLLARAKARLDALEAAVGTVTVTKGPASGSPLSSLLQHFSEARQATTTTSARTERDAAGAWPELPGLEEIRQLWTEVRADGQLRQSLQLAPENGGPLNSGVLVNRSLKLMRDTSPAYLRHFLAYIDTLAWLDQLRTTSAQARDSARPTAPRKRASRTRSPT